MILSRIFFSLETIQFLEDNLLRDETLFLNFKDKFYYFVTSLKEISKRRKVIEEINFEKSENFKLINVLIKKIHLILDSNKSKVIRLKEHKSTEFDAKLVIKNNKNYINSPIESIDEIGILLNLKEKYKKNKNKGFRFRR